MQQFKFAAVIAVLALACDDTSQGTPTLEDEDAAVDSGRVLADAARPDASCVPSEELCNGVDDNCDGNIDEGFDGLGGVCSNDQGPCPSNGTWVCADDGNGTVCDAPVRMPEDELCDGVDNDCDGTADEVFDFADDAAHCGGCGRACAFENATAACFEGVCELVACEAGFGDANMVPVDGCECAVDGAGETCNEVDDDCDGTVDEGLGVGEDCTTGVGECAVGGTTVCAPDGAVECDATANAPGAEACDGLDNDCDGSIDEDFDGDGDGAGLCPELECANCAADAPCAALCAAQDCDDNDPARFPGARDVCDDGIDQDCTGADSSCDGPTGRVNAISIAAANGAGCRDFNGDGRADNSLSLAALIADGEIANAIATDDLNLFATALGLSGNGFDLGVLVANAQGGAYTLDPASVDEDGLPRMLFPGARVVDDAFSAGPGRFVLDLPFNGVALAFAVEDTTVTGTVRFVGEDGLSIEDGWITGYVTDEQVQQLLLLVPEFADLVRMFLNADVDTDGDNVPDAYSACLEFSALPQELLGFPPE